MDTEFSLLRICAHDQDSQHGDGKDAEFFKLLCSGHFEAALTQECVKQILDIPSDSSKDLTTLLQGRADELLEAGDVDSQLLVLGISVACLQLFLQQNWTGPVIQKLSVLQLSGRDREIADVLDVDSETAYPLAKDPVLLVIARVLLLHCQEKLHRCQTVGLWLLRTLLTHQALLDERSPTLHTAIQQLIQTISKLEPLMTAEENKKLAVEFHLTSTHALHYYYNPEPAREHMRQAEKLSGLNVELMGALGKRTRFQQKDLSQLVLQVQREGAGDGEMEQSQELQVADKKELPNNVSLDDETVLETIKLANDTNQVNLTPLEQATILGLCHQHRKMVEGQGNIVREESMAYVDYVLAQPSDWCVQSLSLLRRSQWERDSPRRMQRAVMQLEELVNQLTRPGKHCRVGLCQAVALPPHWEIQKELAVLLESMGANSAALEVFERLQMWEDVIRCYTRMGRREKAENLIREQLEIVETPSLFCYLGEVTEDPQYFEKAWHLSNSRSGRAQRLLARHWFAKGEYERSLVHFKLSVTANPLQVGTWFTYGCAALACAQYKIAATAFRRCVNMDNDNFEAWNNLASAYIHDNQKPRAFATLMEAVKWEYRSWRVWENLMMVAVDVGEFAEAMHCYHRLLEIKHKWADAEVVGILVDAITKNLPASKGEDSAPLRPKLLELLGRITAAVTTDSDIWRHYARLLMENPDATDTDNQRGLQYLQKSHRCATQAINWEKEPDKCKQVAQQAVSIAKAYLKFGEKESNSTRAVQLLSSARLMLKGVATKIKQKHVDPVTDKLPEDLVEPCVELDNHLTQITDLIKQRQGS